MEGPHGSGNPEPPETIAWLKGFAWGFGVLAAVELGFWLAGKFTVAL
jgi:hypothetical protein